MPNRMHISSFDWLVRKYIKSGVISFDSDDDSLLDLKFLRECLEQEFENIGNFPTLDLCELTQEAIYSRLEILLANKKIENFFGKLEELYGKIYLFPYVVIMRNYFSYPSLGLHGWHYDGGSLTQKIETKSVFKNKLYLFGKVQFAFQDNDQYGGNIDIIILPKFLRKNLFFLNLIIRLANFCNTILRKTRLYKINKVSSYACKLTGGTIKTKPLSAVIFDHHLLHRATPITDSKVLNDLNSFNIVDQAIVESLPKNKYVIYIHYGNEFSFRAYMSALSKEQNWPEERKRIIKQAIFNSRFKNHRMKDGASLVISHLNK